MSALQKCWTLGAFLAWENRQEFTYEFDGFQPVVMTGGSAANSRIQFNLLGLPFSRLRCHRVRVTAAG